MDFGFCGEERLQTRNQAICNYYIYTILEIVFLFLFFFVYWQTTKKSPPDGLPDVTKEYIACNVHSMAVAAI